MKHLYALLLVIIGLKSYAQNTITIDNSFIEKELFNNILYYQDTNNTATIEGITDKSFSLYNKSFPGKKNIKFWFLMNLNNNTLETKSLVLKINSATISKLKVYQYDKNNSFKIISEFKNSLQRKIDIPITIERNKDSRIYLEVLFSRSVFFPSKIVSSHRNKELENRYLIGDALFYGFTLVVFIINLLFFIQTKNRFFIYYCFLLLAILLSVMNAQGGFDYFLKSNHVQTKIVIILVLNFLTISSYIAFTTNALELHKYYPKHKTIAISIICPFVLLAILYFITHNTLWYSLAKVFYFTGMIVYWLYGIILFKRLLYARFLTLAYTILMFSQIAYMISVNFGYTQIGFTYQYYKIGCIIEMLVFLYAISYRHKDVEEKRTALANTYAKSVNNIKKLKAEVELQQQKKAITLEGKIEYFKKTFDLNLREIQVLKGHLQGLKNKEIGQELALSEASIKHYNKRLFEKTNTKNKVQLINAFNSVKKE